MVYILIAILIFGVLIAVHELGHFLAAKACGVRVNEFSIGMGPQLLHKTKGDTEYSLRLLPIGGYCAMEGEDEDSDELQMNDDTWYVIRNTRGVTGFVGPEGKPVPLTDDEIYALGVEKKVVEGNYKKGDMVSIIDGAFEGVIGVVDNVDTDNNSVRVVISMLGRETPVDLELDQVEAINN